jgi:hypothetical protein
MPCFLLAFEFGIRTTLYSPGVLMEGFGKAEGGRMKDENKKPVFAR